MRFFVLCLMPMTAMAQDTSWKTEIDNNLVHVSRRLVGPRETVATELPPALLVFLTDHLVRLTAATRREELRGKPGAFFWHSGGRIRLENLSEHRLELAEVTPKFNPASAEPRTALNGHNVKFENDLIRVAHIQGAVGRRKAERPYPSLVIQLSTAHFRLTHVDGRVEEIRAKFGEIRFEAPGAIAFENLGDPLEALRIDLKTGARDRE